MAETAILLATKEDLKILKNSLIHTLTNKALRKDARVAYQEMFYKVSETYDKKFRSN